MQSVKFSWILLHKYFCENSFHVILYSGGVHQCAVCKTQLEHFGLSRPLIPANCELYGIAEPDLKPDMRICNNCRCKSVRQKYKQ